MRMYLRLVTLALAAWAAPIAAGPTLPVMPGYKRTAFTVEQAAPGNVTAIAQTPDGFLWIGTAQGLWRFDGITFERISALEKIGGSGVRSLLVTRRGDLWIGYGFGGVAHARGGRVLPLPGNEAPKGWSDSIAEAPDGAIWTASSGALFRYANGRWTRRKYPDFGRATQALVAGNGSVWICAQTDGQARLLRVDSATLAPTVVAKLDGACALARHSDGSVLVADQKQLRRVDNGAFAGSPNGIAPFPGKMIDATIGVGHSGDMWIAAASRRIARIGRGGETVTFESAAGAANYSSAPFEDREGNWWVGTDQGIDRFHPVDVVAHSAVDPRLLSLLSTELSPYQVLADGQKTIFVRVDRHFFRIGLDGDAIPLTTRSLGPDSIACAARDAGLWIRTAGDTVRLVGGARARSVRVPPAKSPLRASSRCFEDRDGRLWLGIPPHGLIRHEPDGRNPQIMAFDDRPETIPYLMAQGREGVVTYVGYGYTAGFDGRRFRTLIGYERNPFTFIGAMLASSEGLLLAGESGLGMLRSGRIHMLGAGENGTFGDVSGLVQNAAGETWLLSQAGLVRLPSAALAARLNGGAGALPSRIFDHDDGVVGRSNIRGFTDLVEAADGRLWFANQTGIYSLDPRNLRRNVLPPPVVIRAVIADGKPIAPAPSLRLAAGTRGLQIDFTATSLGVPRRVAFRYRLEGVDTGWVDPGARRQAIYTGLGPGTYRFQVIASNDDGVWNRTGATMEVVIPPTFVESRWFVLLCVMAALSAGWLLYALRIRRLNRRFDALLHERLDERERIARDLHDTLLQALQGLILRFQVVANRLPAESALRGSLDQALDRAEAVIVEGRDKVRDLRSEGGVALETRIGESIQALEQEGVTHVTLTIEGTQRPLSRRASEEASAIAEEALRNASRHAAAGHVAVVVTYSLAALSLTVRDDGRGIDPEEAASKRRDGHFGLVGMEERAVRAGGTLSVSTRRGRGTEIVLTIPALAAYGRQRVANPSFWRRSLRR